MSLLLSSHALPLLSYLVPQRLVGEVRVGTAVVVPLSGHPRLGVVVGFEEAGVRPDDRPGEDRLKEIRAVARRFSLPASTVKLCLFAAGAAALPPHAVLRMALPPGLDIEAYEVLRPAPDWPWKAGASVGRRELRRVLGSEGLLTAERNGRVAFAPAVPAPRTVEWVELADREAVNLEPPRRAHRQRAMLAALADHNGGRPVADLLRAAGAGRDVLRRLVRRGLVRLEERSEPAPIVYTKGSGADLVAYEGGAEEALSRGGGASFVWRMPDGESVVAAAAVARAAARRGGQTLVLAPRAGDVERLVEMLVGLLPAGLTVAPYHNSLGRGGRGRAAVYGAARRGEVDVLVGTRAAVFVPLRSLGAVCVVDEPNGAHRSYPGYEGLPIHVREPARARARIEGAPAVFFSPSPSLRLYAPESGALRLPPVEPVRWPAVAVVDMRGTGAPLSSALIGACRRTVQRGGRAGVVANRTGHAASFSCSRCGLVWKCPTCGALLGLRGARPGASGEELLFCAPCGRGWATAPERCPECSSTRVGGTGLTAERARAELADALGAEIGLPAAGEEASVVVGTAANVLEGEWDLVVVLDADPLFSDGSGSVEKGFRLLYRAAGASRGGLLVQTRVPDHPALGAALRGDYEAFAAEELPKRRALMYPPHAHLAEVTLDGPEEAVRRAVESRVRPALAEGVDLLLSPPPAPLAASSAEDGVRPAWRVLLRSRRRGVLQDAAALVARVTAETRGRDAIKARVNMDPEEV